MGNEKAPEAALVSTSMEPVEAVFRVVGMTFVPGYPGNLHQISEVMDRSTTPESLSAVLKRAPDNPYDANAVEVHVPAVGMVGHLSRDDAAMVAPMLDSPMIRCLASVYGVRIASNNPDNPGIDILVSLAEIPLD